MNMRIIDNLKLGLIVLIIARMKLAEFIPALSLSSRYIYFSIVLVAALSLVYSFFTRSVRILPEAQILFLWVIWVIYSHMTFHTHLTGEYHLTHYRFLLIGSSAVVFLALNSFFVRYPENKLFKGLVYGGAIYVFITIVNGDSSMLSFTMNDDMIEEYFRDNPNGFAYTVLLPIMGGLVLLRRYKGLRRALLLSFISVGSMLIIISASRKTFLGLLVLIFGYLYLQSPKMREWLNPIRAIAAVLVVLVLIVALGYVVNNTWLGEQLTDFVYEDFASNERIEFDDRFSGRGRFYSQAFDLVMDHPEILLTGIGLDNFTMFDVRHSATHSEFISLFVETGIVGGVLYFGVYVVILLRIRKTIKATKDANIIFNMRYFQLCLAVILLMGLGRWNWDFVPNYVLVAVIGNYTAYYASKVSISKYYETSNLRHTRPKLLAVDNS